MVSLRRGRNDHPRARPPNPTQIMSLRLAFCAIRAYDSAV
jgi:hypothetical protein